MGFGILKPILIFLRGFVVEFKGVLMLSDSFFPVVGGREMVIHKMMEAFHELGIYAVLGTTTFSKLQHYDDSSLCYKVVRSKGISFTKNEVLARPNKKFKEQIEAEIKAGRVSCVHIQTKFGLCKYAFKLKKKYGIKVVANCHTDYPSVYKKTLKFTPLANLLVRRVKKILNKADKVVTVSEFMKSKLVKMGVTKDITVIPNGNNFCGASVSSEDIKRVNDKYGWGENEDILIFVGRIHEVKAIDVILKALAVSKKAPKIVFIGSGDVEKYSRLAKELNVAEKCQFLGAITDQEELKAICARALLQIYPSVTETFGLTIRECGAMQTPSVVTRGMATAEGMVDKYNGFITDGTPEDVARAIDEALEDKEQLKIVSENARVTMNTSWKDVARRYVEEY